MSLEIEVAECFLVHLLLLCFRWRFILRWRNTRHKNPQLVAQHCFVARFCWLLPFFTLCDQLVAQQKHLLQVEESCCEKKSTGLLWATNFGFVARFFSNSQLVLQQICSCATNQPISTPHFFNPQQVDEARWKTRNIDPKLTTKQCCTTSWGFLYLVFRHL